MNAHDDEQHYDPRAPHPAPGLQRHDSQLAIADDPSQSAVHGPESVPSRDAEAASTDPVGREVRWVRPSDLPMVVLAPALGGVVDRSLTAQSNAARSVVRAPAVASLATSRRMRARRAVNHVKGLGR